MKTSRQLVDEAKTQVVSLGLEEARQRLGAEGVVFVDLREHNELAAEGVIPGAFHAPRGLLEFWADPASPWSQTELTSAKQLVLFCAAGWRSALAAKALQDMGRPEVCHLGEGFNAWKSAGAPVRALADDTPIRPPAQG